MNTMFTMTNAAILATKKFRDENPEFAGQNLRVYLAGKGCDGFEYGVTFDQASADDKTQAIDADILIMCDPQAIEFLVGSEIDFVDDERGKGFLVTNPNHKKFRGKFFKRSSWLEKSKSPPEISRQEANTNIN